MRHAMLLLLAGCISLTREFPENNKAGLCGNDVLDGAESDIDCGGGKCPQCTNNHACNVAEDCESNICETGTCKAPRCDDSARGPTETDVDCGGVCTPCKSGMRCNSDNDCAFGRCASFTCEQQTATLRDNAAAAGFGQSLAMINDTLAVVAASGSLLLYTKGTSSFTQTARIAVSDPAGLAIDDDAVFLGVPSDTLPGRVEVYPILMTGSSGALAASGATGGDGFGTRIAMGQTQLAVTAPGVNSTYVFAPGASGWTQKQKLPGSDGIAAGLLLLAIGSSGSVTVYTGTPLAPQQTLPNPDGTPDFGAELAVLNDDLVVGARGAAFVYHRTGTTWALQATLKGEPQVTTTPTVRTVAIGPDVVAMGEANGGEIGRVHIYYRHGVQWFFNQTITGNGSAPGNLLGAALLLRDKLLIIGAPRDGKGEVSVLGN